MAKTEKCGAAKIEPKCSAKHRHYHGKGWGWHFSKPYSEWEYMQGNLISIVAKLYKKIYTLRQPHNIRYYDPFYEIEIYDEKRKNIYQYSGLKDEFDWFSIPQIKGQISKKEKQIEKHLEKNNSAVLFYSVGYAHVKSLILKNGIFELNGNEEKFTKLALNRILINNLATYLISRESGKVDWWYEHLDFPLQDSLWKTIYADEYCMREAFGQIGPKIAFVRVPDNVADFCNQMAMLKGRQKSINESIDELFDDSNVLVADFLKNLTV